MRVRPGWLFPVFCVSAIALTLVRPMAVAPAAQDAGGKAVYDQLKAFALTGGSAKVDQLVLKRDRVEMRLTGTLHFMSPVAGRVTGAVFTGEGTLRAEAPPSDFEKEQLKRLLSADLVESDFRTAVLRWTDDTFDVISGGVTESAAPPQMQRLAVESDARFTLETGINLPARLAVSLLNGERPGVQGYPETRGVFDDRVHAGSGLVCPAPEPGADQCVLGGRELPGGDQQVEVVAVAQRPRRVHRGGQRRAADHHRCDAAVFKRRQPGAGNLLVALGAEFLA